jgi:hypothetical protein
MIVFMYGCMGPFTADLLVLLWSIIGKNKQANFVAFSSKAKYTAWATATAGEVMPPFADRGVSHGQHNRS